MCIDFGILPKSDNIFDCKNNNISSYLYHRIHIIVFNILFWRSFSYSLHFHVQFTQCIFTLPNYLVHFKLSFSSLHFIIDHVWTNAPTQQCISGVLEAYWTNHKPIYFAFKLPNYVP